MLYDLIADFYEKSSDRHPKYIVLMGTYNENTFDEMKIPKNRYCPTISGLVPLQKIKNRHCSL